MEHCPSGKVSCRIWSEDGCHSVRFVAASAAKTPVGRLEERVHFTPPHPHVHDDSSDEENTNQLRMVRVGVAQSKKKKTRPAGPQHQQCHEPVPKPGPFLLETFGSCLCFSPGSMRRKLSHDAPGKTFIRFNLRCHVSHQATMESRCLQTLLHPGEGEDVLVQLWESLGRCREGPDKMMTYHRWLPMQTVVLELGTRWIATSEVDAELDRSIRDGPPSPYPLTFYLTFPRPTYQTTVVLNRFQPVGVEGTGRTRPFDPDKEPATLNAYTRRAKPLFAYIYRVVTSEEPYFNVSQEINMAGPNHTVKLTEEQIQLWERIIRSWTPAVNDGPAGFQWSSSCGSD